MNTEHKPLSPIEAVAALMKLNEALYLITEQTPEMDEVMEALIPVIDDYGVKVNALQEIEATILSSYGDAECIWDISKVVKHALSTPEVRAIHPEHQVVQ